MSFRTSGLLLRLDRTPPGLESSRATALPQVVAISAGCGFTQIAHFPRFGTFFTRFRAWKSPPRARPDTWVCPRRSCGGVESRHAVPSPGTGENGEQTRSPGQKVSRVSDRLAASPLPDSRRVPSVALAGQTGPTVKKDSRPPSVHPFRLREDAPQKVGLQMDRGIWFGSTRNGTRRAYMEQIDPTRCGLASIITTSKV
jgi:hypothetical protein